MNHLKNVVDFPKRLLASSLSLIYPPICLSCREPLSDPSTHLCPSCGELLHLIDVSHRCPRCFTLREGGTCPSCSRHGMPLHGCAAACDHYGPAASLIKALDTNPLLAKGLGGYMIAQFFLLQWPMPDIITYVPDTAYHTLFRGFPPSYHLAFAVADYLSLSPRSLLRKKASSFSLRRRCAIEDKCVLLITDVIGSCPAIRHCAELLLSRHPSHLYCLAFSKKDSAFLRHEC